MAYLRFGVKDVEGLVVDGVLSHVWRGAERSGRCY
jgi:hypothetical protein